MSSIKDKPLTFEDIETFLKSCNNLNENFMQFKAFNAIIDNENYNPSDFDEEIEASEPDYNKIALKEGRYVERQMKIFNSSTYGIPCDEPVNSEKWINNHQKKCEVTLERNIVVLSAEQHSSDYKDFYSEKNVKAFREWYDSIVNKKLNIYRIS